MKKSSKITLFFLALLLVGLLYPQHFVMPVSGADKNSYNPDSFWHYPWGKSVTHKGVDIFAKAGTDVFSSTGGLVIFAGQIRVGGNVVSVLGPKWRLHYYAHLQDIKTSSFSWTHSGETIGTVGNTGNAAGKPAHLHYSIMTPLPYFWQVDGAKQGWRKMFYLNPIKFLRATQS